MSVRLAAVAGAVLPLVVLALGGRSHTLRRAGGAALAGVYVAFVVLALA